MKMTNILIYVSNTVKLTDVAKIVEVCSERIQPKNHITFSCDDWYLVKELLRWANESSVLVVLKPHDGLRYGNFASYIANAESIQHVDEVLAFKGAECPVTKALEKLCVVHEKHCNVIPTV